MRMTAAVLEGSNKPLRILDLDVPKLCRGQVLVKVLFSAICRSQIMEIRGSRGTDKWLPHLLGHEAAGIVLNIGPGVTKVQPDEEVILTWIKSSGIDCSGPQFMESGRKINAGPITTFSNYSIVAENRIIKKPPIIDAEIATLFGCALVTGPGMVLNELEIEKDQSVVVLGLGGVGMGALTACIAAGISKVIAIDKDVSKCELARSFGAMSINTSHNEQWKRDIFQLTDGGADFCIEAGGTTRTIELGFSLLKPGSGTLLFASHPPAGEYIKLDPHELISGKQIKGSWGGGVEPDRDIPLFCRLFQSSNIPLRKLLTNTYDLSEINQAVHDFEAGEIFRPILKMQH